MDPRPVAGIVLAAGRSRRMGEPKPLLDADGQSFLVRSIEALRGGGCDPVLAVVPGWDAPLRAAVTDAAERAGARTVANRDREAEQIESLRLGLDALDPGVGAAVVLPVDHPLVRAATVTALVARWREAPDRIVRPVHDGRPGHPTVFPRAVWPALRADLPRGARTVVEDGSHGTVDVVVEDPGILADLNTPAAYTRWVAGR